MKCSRSNVARNLATSAARFSGSLVSSARAIRAASVGTSVSAHAPANQFRRADPEAVHIAWNRLDRQADAASEKARLAQCLRGGLTAAIARRLDRELVGAGEALGLGEDRHAFGIERCGERCVPPSPWRRHRPGRVPANPAWSAPAPPISPRRNWRSCRERRWRPAVRRSAPRWSRSGRRPDPPRLL